MRNYLKGTRDFNYFLEMLVIGDVGIEKKDTRLKDLQRMFLLNYLKKQLNKDTIYLITYCLEVISMPAMLKKSIPTPLIQKETF